MVLEIFWKQNILRNSWLKLVLIDFKEPSSSIFIVTLEEDLFNPFVLIRDYALTLLSLNFI